MTAHSAEPGRFSRLVTEAPALFSKHFWIWPLLGAVALLSVGYWVRTRIEGATRQELASRLTTSLNANISALRLWCSERESDAKSYASDVRIQGVILELVQLAGNSNSTPAALADSATAQAMRLYLGPLLETRHYVDYLVISQPSYLTGFASQSQSTIC